MDPIEDLLRDARHAPPATFAGLAEVRRRGRRRHDVTRAAVASGGLAVVAAGAVFVGALADSPAAVVSSGASPSAASTEALVVAGTVTWADATLSADGATVTVRYSGGPPGGSPACQHRVRARADETTDAVTITLETVVPSPAPSPDPNVLCQARLYQRSETVVLRAPVGERRVLDGSDGRERPVRR